MFHWLEVDRTQDADRRCVDHATHESEIAEMGRRGPLPKSKDEAQGNRPHAEIVLLQGQKLEAPKPDKAWLAKTRDAWLDYWSSAVVTLADEVDVPAITRLFDLRDQHERALRKVASTPLVSGSMGQLVMNPLAGYMKQLDGSISKLENELGLTPLARMRLGVATGEAAKSLAEMNATFASGDVASDEDEIEIDPRRIIDI